MQTSHSDLQIERQFLREVFCHLPLKLLFSIRWSLQYTKLFALNKLVLCIYPNAERSDSEGSSNVADSFILFTKDSSSPSLS